MSFLYRLKDVWAKTNETIRMIKATPNIVIPDKIKIFSVVNSIVLNNTNSIIHDQKTYTIKVMINKHEQSMIVNAYTLQTIGYTNN